MNKIGLLPASGKAERLGGIPKFLFPINSKKNLLQWHIDKMLEVCDEVRVSTRSIWIPLIEELKLSNNVKIYEIEPSTMSDACNKMIDDDSKYLIGMPDTYIHNSNNFYKNLAESDYKISISVFNCYNNLKGNVGQVLIKDGYIVKSVDKKNDCDWNHMWGAIAIQDIELNEKYHNPGIQIEEWIKTENIRAIEEPGKYIDLGTFEGVKEFYSTI